MACALALASTAALLPATPVHAQARALPDFTDLVDQVGPSVVNIRTIEKVAQRRRAAASPDEEMQEFFRRFFGQPHARCPAPEADARIGRRRRRTKSGRAASARASS